MEQTRMAPWRALVACVASLTLALALVPTAAIGPVQAAWAVEGTALTESGGTLSAGTYYLSGDVTLTTDITVASGTTLTLDLNGHTLTGTGSTSVVTVDGGTFTLKDSSDDGSGVLTGGSRGTGAGVYVKGSGTFTLDGGTISGNTGTSNCGGVYIYASSADASFTMTGGTISGNTSSGNGGGIGLGASSSSYTASFTMSGGTISNNTASSYGGGVYVGGYASFKITGGTISGNTGATYGGGVYLGAGTFAMSGGAISGNTASYGGGVYVYEGATFTMSGGAISGNTASYGGGVYVYSKNSSTTFTMSGGAISGNTASYGGGVYSLGPIRSTAKMNLSMSSCEISDNTAAEGGGVYVAAGITAATITLSGCTVSGNTATSSSGSYGGGVYLDGTTGSNSQKTTLALSNGTAITGNKATTTSSSSKTYGGGVYAVTSTAHSVAVTMASGCEISGNEATYGGGLYLKGSSSSYTAAFTMSGGEITGNEASTGGGVYAYAYTSFTMSSGEITDNEAGSIGGGVVVYGTSSGGADTFTATGGTLANNTAGTRASDLCCFAYGSLTGMDKLNGGALYEATGRAIDGWYDDSEGSRWSTSSTSTSVTVSDGQQSSMLNLIAAYDVSAEQYVTFLGGSLRYSVSDEKTSASDYSSDAGSTDLRLGFTYQLPVDSSGSVTASNVTIYYAVGTDYDTVAAVSGYSACKYSGTARREYGAQDYSGGYATYLSNVVVTDISAAWYANEVYARVWVVYTDDSTSEEVVLASGTVSRSVGDVCEAILSTCSSKSTDAEKAYATALCAAYHTSQKKALYDGAPTSTSSSTDES